MAIQTPTPRTVTGPATTLATKRPGPRRPLLAAAVAVTAAAATGLMLTASLAGPASAATAPRGYPSAATTGVPAGTTLRTVPTQVSSGTGWHYDARARAVEVTGTGAVLTGLRIPYNVDISASGVTISQVQVTTGGNYAISLRHTTGVTIANSTISGLNATTGRASYAIDDVYGDSTAMVIKNDNIYAFRTAIQVTTGLITGNYIHDPGYIAGDHTNGIYVGGSTKPLTISGNTIFDNLNQTDAINLDAPGPRQEVANKTITANLLGGGSYSIYAGHTLGAVTSNIVITGNRFSQTYYPHGGRYGSVTFFNSQGAGNIWAGNVWDTSGQAVLAA